MPLPTLGDLAQNYVQRTNITRLNSTLSTLSKELSTGLVADLPTAMRGETQSIAAINRGLSALDSYDLSAKEADIVLGATDRSITQSRNRLSALFEMSVNTMSTADPGVADVVAARARQDFEGMLSDLNSQSGGLRLFSGIATDGPALRDSADIFADIVAAASGATTAQDVRDAIDLYFQPGGAFDTNDYIGDTTSRGAVQLGYGETVDYAPRADDPAFRDALKALAGYAVLDAGVLAGAPGEKLDFVRAQRDAVLNADDSLVELQARGGAAQARVETAQTRNAAEREGLETARLGFVAADPFETATRLQETQTQLESLYAVTARLSRLNLTSYL